MEYVIPSYLYSYFKFAFYENLIYEYIWCGILGSFFFFFFCCFMRQRLTLRFSLILKTLCNPAWPWTHSDLSASFLNDQITSMCHHTQIGIMGLLMKCLSFSIYVTYLIYCVLNSFCYVLNSCVEILFFCCSRLNLEPCTAMSGLCHWFVPRSHMLKFNHQGDVIICSLWKLTNFGGRALIS